ncbi:MAG: hypothetical protein LBJ00_01805 [Planctomycetaceae bacterium]|nr:hypothetical protein [Planctomycetaceae bacterium]
MSITISEYLSVICFVRISVSLADILVVEPEGIFLNNSEIWDDSHRQPGSLTQF